MTEYIGDQLMHYGALFIATGVVGAFRFARNRKLPMEHWKFQETQFDDSWFYKLIGKTGQPIHYDFDLDRVCMIANNSLMDTVIHQSSFDSRVCLVVGGVGIVMFYSGVIAGFAADLMR